MSKAKKPRMVGFNHVALEVGDIDAALAFYGRLFDFELRSRDDSMAFIDLGDQFLALQKGRSCGSRPTCGLARGTAYALLPRDRCCVPATH